MKKALSKKNLWAAMPSPLKKVAAYILRAIPLNYLIGKSFRDTERLIQTAETWSRLEIEQYQLEQLKKQVELAYQKCPAYKKLYDDENIDISSLRTLADFKTLPLIDKSFINNNIDDLLLVDKNNSDVDYITTGGTSGVPLTFYFNAGRSQIEYAYLVDGWKRAGFRLGDLKTVLRGSVTGTINGVNRSYDPIFKEHYYSSFHTSEKDMAEYVAHLKSLNKCFLHVYPSSVYQLARYIKKMKISITNVQAILAESENVYPEQRKFVESVFNCRYFSSYGHTEKLVAAAECEHSSHYHVWPTYGYFELIDEQGDVITEAGKTGEIVGTGFMNTVMPFIRYRTGDYAEYVDNNCDKCNRNYPIIRDIRGHRVQEHLVAIDNSLIPWTAVNMHDDTFDNVIKYQFYQDTPGNAIIKVVVNDNFTDLQKYRIEKNIGKKLDGKVTTSVKVVESIQLTDRGKSIFVDQKIKL